MKAILYCRVDGPENPFTMDALRGQQEALIAYAQAHGMELEQIHMDIGCPGTTLDRCGLQSVIQAVRDGSADVILVANRSRLFRGPLPPELEGLPVIAVKEREAGLDREAAHELWGGLGGPALPVLGRGGLPGLYDPGLGAVRLPAH